MSERAALLVRTNVSPLATESFPPPPAVFAERITFAKDRLLKAKAARPRTRKTLASHVSAMFLKEISDDVATVVDGLVKNGTVSEKGKRIEYSDERT